MDILVSLVMVMISQCILHQNIKVNTINICNCLFVSYTSIKLEKKIPFMHKYHMNYRSKSSLGYPLLLSRLYY